LVELGFCALSPHGLGQIEALFAANQGPLDLSRRGDSTHSKTVSGVGQNLTEVALRARFALRMEFW